MAKGIEKNDKKSNNFNVLLFNFFLNFSNNKREKKAGISHEKLFEALGGNIFLSVVTKWVYSLTKFKARQNTNSKGEKFGNKDFKVK